MFLTKSYILKTSRNRKELDRFEGSPFLYKRSPIEVINSQNKRLLVEAYIFQREDLLTPQNSQLIASGNYQEKEWEY